MSQMTQWAVLLPQQVPVGRLTATACSTVSQTDTGHRTVVAQCRRHHHHMLDYTLQPCHIIMKAIGFSTLALAIDGATAATGASLPLVDS